MMHSRVSSVFLSLLLALCVSTHDIILGPAKGESVGAAYFITNHPEANYVIASDIGPDGKVTLRRAVHAGGVGAHGIFPPTAVDPLFSQGCIEVASKTNILVTVNAANNTLVAFKINPQDPTDIKMIGKPIPSNGDFPNSVVFNKAEDMVCAVNAGVNNAISCYSIDPCKGLELIPNTIRPLGVIQTNPPNIFADSSSQIIFTEDEKQLIVPVKSIGKVPNQPGFCAVWDIIDGVISENYTNVTMPAGGLLPFGVTVIQNQNALLVTDPFLGYDILDLSDVNGRTNNSRSTSHRIEGQGAACWSAFSPRTGNYYISDPIPPAITEVHVDDNLNATIVRQHMQPLFSGSIDIDIVGIGEKDYLYILAANVTAIDVQYLNGPAQVTDIQRLDFSAATSQAGIPIDPNNLQGMTIYLKEQKSATPV